MSVFAIGGLVGCVVLYVASVFGLQVQEHPSIPIALISDLAFVYLPAYAAEYPRSRSSPLLTSSFAGANQRRSVGTIRALSVFGLVNAFLFVLYGRLGFPSYINSQYALVDHGRIVRVLSYAEYAWVSALLLRGITSLALPGYFACSLFWWQRKKQGKA